MGARPAIPHVRRHSPVLIEAAIAVVVFAAVADFGTGTGGISGLAIRSTAANRRVAITILVRRPLVRASAQSTSGRRLTWLVDAVCVDRARVRWEASIGHSVAVLTRTAIDLVNTRASRITKVASAGNAVIAITDERIRPRCIHACIVMVRRVVFSRATIVMIRCIDAERILAHVGPLTHGRAAEEAEGEEDGEIAKGHVGQL